MDRVRRAARRPVEHVVVDLDTERDDVKRTLVVANQTVASPELLDVLRRKAAAGAAPLHRDLPEPTRNGDGSGSGDAAERLAHTLKALEDAGLEAIGQVVAPRPVHGHPERAAVLRARRHRDLDLPRDALRAGCAPT